MLGDSRVDDRVVDLCELYRAVLLRGGAARLGDDPMAWFDIGESLWKDKRDFDERTLTNAARERLGEQLRAMYEQQLAPFAAHLASVNAAKRAERANWQLYAATHERYHQPPSSKDIESATQTTTGVQQASSEGENDGKPMKDSVQAKDTSPANIEASDAAEDEVETEILSSGVSWAAASDHLMQSSDAAGAHVPQNHSSSDQNPETKPNESMHVDGEIAVDSKDEQGRDPNDQIDDRVDDGVDDDDDDEDFAATDTAIDAQTDADGDAEEQGWTMTTYVRPGDEDVHCEICKKDDDGFNMLLCDGW